MPDFRRHSNLRMYAEVRSSLMESVDSIKDLAEELRKKFVVVQEEEDQLILEVNPESNETLRLKLLPAGSISGWMPAGITINLLAPWKKFKNHFPSINSQRKSSVSEFKAAIYIRNRFLDGIFTTGILLDRQIYQQSQLDGDQRSGGYGFFRESGLKVNLACRIMTPDQVDEYFSRSWTGQYFQTELIYQYWDRCRQGGEDGFLRYQRHRASH